MLNDKVRTQTAITAEIAECYFAMNEPEKAAQAWEYRYEITESFLAAIQVAKAWIRAGSYKDAFMWIEQASLLDPTSTEIELLRDQLENMNSDK